MQWQIHAPNNSSLQHDIVRGLREGLVLPASSEEVEGIGLAASTAFASDEELQATDGERGFAFFRVPNRTPLCALTCKVLPLADCRACWAASCAEDLLYEASLALCFNARLKSVADFFNGFTRTGDAERCLFRSRAEALFWCPLVLQLSVATAA
mmetsp:Transcript_120255/g.239342  ORF Transcript_120255/g.239342 Transcript_120255/m.239342 type:complete len:154 (-) Transcript_120255:1349-1810(-)